jgi:hypothetical protein
MARPQISIASDDKRAMRDAGGMIWTVSPQFHCKVFGMRRSTERDYAMGLVFRSAGETWWVEPVPDDWRELPVAKLLSLREGRGATRVR